MAKPCSFPTRQYGQMPWPNPWASPYWRMALVPPEYWDAPRREATYAVQFLPLLGGQTGVDEFDIKADGPFIIYGLTAYATNPGATPPVLRWGANSGSGFPSRVLCQITDSKYGDLFNKMVPLDNIAGDSGDETPWIPYVCEPGVVITVKLTNQNLPGGGEDWNWFLDFRGAELLMPGVAA